jgi:hypothetical protein
MKDFEKIHRVLRTIGYHARGIIMTPYRLYRDRVQRARCERGRHGMTDPNGYCTDCYKSVERGRGDTTPDGCLWVSRDEERKAEKFS